MLAIKKTRGRNMRITTGLGVLTGLAFVGGPADATTSITQSLSVSMTITAQCIFTSTTPTLAFASNGVLTANVDATATVSVQCTNSLPFNIGLDAGTTTGGTTTTRLMAGGSSETIQYKLFQDANHMTNWGNTIGTDTNSLTGTGAAVNYTIYGRVAPQSTPSASSYTDTVTITVTY
jgi:spore coat protein U-like protein